MGLSYQMDLYSRNRRKTGITIINNSINCKLNVFRKYII